MNYYVFELKNLFSNNKIYFRLFDGLFNFTATEKHRILQELNCNPSTYRSQKLRGTRNKDMIFVILNYFKYKDFNFSLENEYNILLSKIYYCCYYKISKQYENLLGELNREINENNILRPVLMLFRCLLNTSFGSDYRKMSILVQDDLDYLLAFNNTNYFIGDFNFIFQTLLYFYNYISKDEEYKIDKMSLMFPKISWVWFFLKGSRAYLDKKNDVALANFEILISDYESTNNIERYFMALNNVACLYNLSSQYVASLKVTEKVIEYVFSSHDEDNKITNILMHYLFSKIMLGCYQEIVDFISIIIFDFKTLNVVSTIICIIASFKVNSQILLKKLLSIEHDEINYKAFISYIISKDFTMLDNIENTPYLLKLKSKMAEINKTLI